MTNADQLSELVRTGSLDFALLKPMDTQFLVSFTRIEWSSLGNFVVGLCLIGYSMWAIAVRARSGANHSLPDIYCVRCGGLLQSDDCVGGDERMAGPQPDVVRFLVLYYKLLAVSDGDIQRSVGHAVAPAVYVRHSVLVVVNVPARFWFGPLPRNRSRIGSCRVSRSSPPSAVWPRRVGYFSGTSELSQREQLIIGEAIRSCQIVRRCRLCRLLRDWVVCVIRQRPLKP